MTASESTQLSIEAFATDEVRQKIEEAIRLAELNTSGELRVHIENTCPEDPLDRTSFIFEHLGMHKTALRNGVLIYVALQDRKVAIIGDAGINRHMPANSWDHIREDMTSFFRQGKIEEGILTAVHQVGKKIQTLFPIDASDKNELTNTVSTGNIGRKS